MVVFTTRTPASRAISAVRSVHAFATTTTSNSPGGAGQKYSDAATQHGLLIVRRDDDAGERGRSRSADRFVRGEQRGAGDIPRQGASDALAPEFTHPRPSVGVVQELRDQDGEG